MGVWSWGRPQSISAPNSAEGVRCFIGAGGGVLAAIGAADGTGGDTAGGTGGDWVALLPWGIWGAGGP